MWVSTIVGLGANLGDRAGTLLRAIALLGGTGDSEIIARSALYETEAVGESGEGLGDEQPAYLNAAVRIRTRLDPEALLDRLLSIERDLGRDRAAEGGRCRPRPVDLDVLWMEGVSLATPSLTVPHPRLTERSFALAPLLDVAPELVPRYGAALERHGGRPPAVSWPEVGPNPLGC